MDIGRSALRDKPYFGWRIVAALVLCSACLVGIAISSFIMFSAPLTAEFGWSEAQTGLLISAMWFTGPLALAAGPLVTRIGPWRTVAIGMVVQVISLIGVAYVTSYTQMIALRFVMGLGLVLMVPAGPVILSRWFKRRFATAMSIMWAASAAGQIIFAPLTLALDDAMGWRNTALVLAAIMAAALGIALLVSRAASTPEQLGMVCEGAADDDIAHAADLDWRKVLAALDWKAASAMCCAVLAAGLFSMAFQSLTPPFFAATGMSQSAIAGFVSLFNATALLGCIVAGWMLDNVPIRAVASLIAVTLLASLVALLVVVRHHDMPLALLANALLGLALGAGEIFWITAFKRRFGTPAFGTTYGIFYCAFQIGLAWGGYVGGVAFERGGPSGFILTLLGVYLVPIAVSLWRPARLGMQTSQLGFQNE